MAASGLTSGTIGHSAGYHRRPRCITPHEPAAGAFGAPPQIVHLYFAVGRLWMLHPLFKADHDRDPLTQALSWVHSRRKFFELADIAASAKHGKNAAPISPMALEAVRRQGRGLTTPLTEFDGPAITKRDRRQRWHAGFMEAVRTKEYSEMLLRSCVRELIVGSRTYERPGRPTVAADTQRPHIAFLIGYSATPLICG